MNEQTITQQAVSEAADRLWEAARSGIATTPVRAVVGTEDLSTAYAVQRELIDRALAGGDRLVGRKVGLTAPAVQAQLGVDQPDFGALLASMEVDGPIARHRVLQPRVEAEIAFVIGRDVTEVPEDPADLIPYVARAVPAIEVVDSRVAGWDITITDTIADNASSGLFALGTDEVRLDADVIREVEARMSVDGEVVSTGRGAACLGSPLAALAWVARTMIGLGTPLRSGEVVLSGALGPMVDAEPGRRYVASFNHDGRTSEVAVEFEEARP
ncbi:fumarylacetoacetate hydrolase family protein [Nocardioides endophyticus]|uniref:Fumarylacetoacetate hydrolase family protein n=1 Tax=Nocardioides endophyticus TaxID=1353775 RepID=A0ABP8YLA1_9ACTN